VISPIGMAISVRKIANMRRVSVREPQTRNRLWQREIEQRDDEILAWFEAYRIAMRYAFETTDRSIRTT
jgi:nuclear transport factor 2 (NTF2) superfamily protein